MAFALPAHADPTGVHPSPTPSGPSRASLTLGESPRTTRGGLDLRIEAGHAFYRGPRTARLSFVLGGARPMHVTVEAVRNRDRVAVARWDLGVVAPGAAQEVEWRGTTNGRIQPEGTYSFRAEATQESSAAGSVPATVQGSADFVFLRHRFPVRGRHGYGDAGARFGAGRGGSRHQGQDVFAACGTPLVAARGGVVQYRGVHSRAGNYLVIDGAGTGVDYVYAHLRDPARFAVGRRVFTGQLIGFVGRTGDATACHLHFEMWTAPGWYAGGATLDPLPSLKAWDKST